jgi:hypothetical protein
MQFVKVILAHISCIFILLSQKSVIKLHISRFIRCQEHLSIVHLIS